MHSRFLKQFIYGFFFLITFSFIGYGFFSISTPAVSCFDGLQNGLETDIDCGGNCLSCQVKYGRDLEIISASLIPLSPTQSSLIVNINNSNAGRGAVSFSYSITVTDTTGKVTPIITDESFIYPSEVKYLIHPTLNINKDNITNLEVSLDNILWASRADFSLPSFTSRQLNYTTDEKFIKLNGLIINNETISFPKVFINALFYNKDNILVGASNTIIYNVIGFEERRFEIAYPLVDFDSTATKIFISALQPDVQGFSVK